MKTKFYFYILFHLVLICLISCGKELKNKDFNQLKYSKNNNTYPKIKLDSVQAINHIATIKIQDLLDLSVLYATGNKDTEIDSVIYHQMQSYFINGDTLHINRLVRELDSLKVKTANVLSVVVNKKIIEKDTLNIAQFQVEYLDNKNKKIIEKHKLSKFVLKKDPVKFAQEFKFYFKDFVENDSISSGIIK